jgi:hypothetical protein
MERELTPSESLKLIETMIAQAKQSFHRNSFYFMLWGVLLIAAMAVNYLMAANGDPRGNYAWAVVGIIGGIASWAYGAREAKRKQASSFMDRVMLCLWMGFLATLLITIFGSAGSGHGMLVGAIIVLTGLPTFVTGQLLRFRPLIFGGILFWVLGAVSFFTDMKATALLYIAAMVFGYLIPGYLLKRQEDGLRTA